MYELNPERNSENMSPFNHKTALHFKFEKSPVIIGKQFVLLVDSPIGNTIHKLMHILVGQHYILLVDAYIGKKTLYIVC